jgi:hypothetical protein
MGQPWNTRLITSNRSNVKQLSAHPKAKEKETEVFCSPEWLYLLPSTFIAMCFDWLCVKSKVRSYFAPFFKLPTIQ